MDTLSSFSLDIYFEIIDAISADRYPENIRHATLRACALTCSAWLGRARFHLYTHVEISEENPN